MLYQIIVPDFISEDERGRLTQLVHTGYTQVNVVTSKAGVLRGNHYHKQSTEAFYVVNGSVEVTLKQGDKQERIIFGCGDFFQIKPYIAHSMRYWEDTTLIALYDIPVELENGEKDIYSSNETTN